MAVRLLALDFDGCMTTNQVFVHQDGTEGVLAWRGDGLGIRRVQKMGIPVHIVSSETNPVVTERGKKLGIPTHQGHESKLVIVHLIASDRKIPLADVCFLGNDINDLRALQEVGYPYIVADAHESVRGYGFRQTKARGGYGAVRELCDLIADGQVQRPGMNVWDMMLRWWG